MIDCSRNAVASVESVKKWIDLTSSISFVETPKFNYAAALSVFILVVVAVLSAIQMKVGDKRE